PRSNSTRCSHGSFSAGLHSPLTEHRSSSETISWRNQEGVPPSIAALSSAKGQARRLLAYSTVEIVRTLCCNVASGDILKETMKKLAAALALPLFLLNACAQFHNP